jgi:acetyl-CoA synthetase
MTDWDWEAAARELGAGRDGRFNAGALRLGQRRALIWHRADGSTRVLSGADLTREGGELARGLRRLGVGPGDRVAGMLGRRPEAFTLALAVWRLGAVFVPLFSGFGRDALAVRLSDSGATLLVVDAPNAESAIAARESVSGLAVASVDARVAGVDHDLAALLERPAGGDRVHDTRLGDAATIMYTSGTSGPPKGCVLPHRAIVSLLPFVRHALAPAPEEVVFSTADTGWSFGLFTTGLAPLAGGATRLLYEGGFDAATWWAVAREHGSTHLASAPTGFRQLALGGEALVGDGLAIRAATSAGEPLTPEVVDWFVEHVGCPIHDSYGLTELGMLVANLRGPGAAPPRAGSMGVAVPGYEIGVFDDADRPVAPGEPGRLAVRDNGWLLGDDYWGRSAEWRARLRDGWWFTEDEVRRDEDGRYWYVGRADDVIVTAGYNVGPVDVEAALLLHDAVADVACVGEPDPRKGQIVAAHVVLSGAADGGEDALLEDLRRWVGGRVGWHAAPGRLHLHDRLPRTESGKVIRRALREKGPSR